VGETETQDEGEKRVCVFPGLACGAVQTAGWGRQPSAVSPT
jgi:hypothetical protein